MSVGSEIVRTFTEVESGKRSDRPELVEALAYAKFARATLVIAKLDRLSRNVAFLSGLMESKVPFVACDNPNATPLTIHIFAAVAEDEAKRISDRTRAALTAYKARGGKLGASLPQCRNLTHEAGVKGAKAAGVVHAEQADEFNRYIAPRIREMRSSGMTLQAIADGLNADGIQTRRGKAWSHVQVLTVLKRYAD